VVDSLEEKLNALALVVFAIMIPLSLAGLSTQLCTVEAERAKVCLPVVEGDTLPATVVPLSSDPLAPAICQEFAAA